MPTSNVASERVFGVVRHLEDDQRRSVKEETVTIETLARVNAWLEPELQQKYGRIKVLQEARGKGSAICLSVSGLRRRLRPRAKGQGPRAKGQGGYTSPKGATVYVYATVYANVCIICYKPPHTYIQYTIYIYTTYIRRALRTRSF